MNNYKRKTILLVAINLTVIIVFFIYPKDINGNPLILLLAIGINIYDLTTIKEPLPKPYLFSRYTFILLLILGLLLSLINR
ncbi:hypothetical protein CAR_c16190 [Carnobacterium sp. 17-4]|nr:hypothetical protein CAR_c16190 [Carnobacterium sp. 17-4]